MDAISINQITKTFGNQKAVDDLSLVIPSESIYGFIGPNGSGKTTTLRMILSIIYPDSGSIELFGQPTSGSLRDDIGYLPEERGLYNKMKVGELIRFFGKLKNTDDLDKKIDYWLERFDLLDWKNKKIDALSKGMSQKVQFIASIISSPKIVILDEPFSGLDPVNAETMRSAVIDLQKQGTTIVFSTHDMGTAEKMCDRIFMIYQGKKVLDGTLAEIQERYGSDTLKVRMTSGEVSMQTLPGIEKITDYGREQDLRLSPGTDTQEILNKLISIGRVERFEIVKPSLHDIFVRIANPEKE